MNKRLTKLRNALRISQEELGERIGLTRFTISNYESGRRIITDRAIADICREFNVNEAWLRTGEGEMFVESDESILGELTVKFGLDELDQRIIEHYLKLPAAHREIIKNYVCGLTSDADPIELEVNAYRAELEAESEAQTSSVSEDSDASAEKMA